MNRDFKWKIDPWLNKGMNSDFERATDCYHCHAAPGTWTPGVDFRGPTCASCHMSGAGAVLTSHDVTERLSWETQAPLTIRPENFKPFPAKKMLDDLYARGLLDKTKFFDERLEVEFYELWHHEGRRARFGAAMMAPDYAGWHGFYECKKRFAIYMEEARQSVKHNKKACKAEDWPNATGNTTRPKEVFPDQQEASILPP